jgi:uncharacterized cupredoxin-like copper-binding protein
VVAAPTVVAGVPINAVGSSKVAGLAYFAQRGQRLDYHVVVYGLTPGSAHAVHIHGPNLPCAKQAGVASVDVGFPDLKANAHGVAAASGTVDLSTIKFKQPLAHGFYYNIHAYPTAQLASKGLAPIACGNISTAGNATAAPASAPAASNASAGSRSKTIEVGMKEFAFLLSTNRALLGTVIFHLKNIGAVAHDFRIDGKTSPIVQPGKSASLTVTFTKKGSYPYLCTIPGHAQAGMKGVLHVV